MWRASGVEFEFEGELSTRLGRVHPDEGAATDSLVGRSCILTLQQIFQPKLGRSCSLSRYLWSGSGERTDRSGELKGGTGGKEEVNVLR